MKDYEVTAQAHQPARLTRTLNLRDLIFLIVGTVIGAGIFLVPGSVLSQVGNSVPISLAVWIGGGVLTLLGALTYGELSTIKPEAGGIYIYLRDCFGRFPAFLYGWAFFFVISSGSAATLAVAFSRNLGEVIPLSPLANKISAIAMIAVVAAVNVRGTRQSANLQNVTTAIKVSALILMSVVLLWFGARSGVDHQPTVAPGASTGLSLFSGIGLAMIGVLWAYEGWQYATFSAGETLDSRRNFPRAFLVGTLALIGIYLLANLAYIAALGPSEVAISKSVAADSVAALIHPRLRSVVALLIATSVFTAANGLTLTSPRVYYAMANDGLFFRKLAEVHPKFGTPAFAVIAGALWASLLAAYGSFEQLFNAVVFTGWIFYGLAAACLFVYRRKAIGSQDAYKTPGYPITPIVFILAAAALVINSIISQPVLSGLGIGIVLLGAPAFLIWRSRSNAPKLT